MVDVIDEAIDSLLKEFSSAPDREEYLRRKAKELGDRLRDLEREQRLITYMLRYVNQMLGDYMLQTEPGGGYAYGRRSIRQAAVDYLKRKGGPAHIREIIQHLRSRGILPSPSLTGREMHSLDANLYGAQDVKKVAPFTWVYVGPKEEGQEKPGEPDKQGS